MFGYEAPLSTSVCRCRSSFQDEFHEGCPKSVVVPETNDAHKNARVDCSKEMCFETRL